MKTKYSISIDELLKRQIIRDDFDGKFSEWMNKMTDDELKQYDKEVYHIAIEEGVLEKFPDLTIAHIW